MMFFAYGLWGNYLPAPWTHKGYPIVDLIAELYMTLNGIFGSAIDVSATLIILFTIFGAILQASGAGRFFIDFSLLAMKGQPNAAGRAVVLSSFLLGGPSGSGVATTVTIGTVAWPIMREAGYGKTAAGGLLAAGGLGAILSPPVLGAAAFLIAEYLKMSYLDIVRMAIVPTCLYYFGLLVMTEIDSRKYRLRAVDPHDRHRHAPALDALRLPLLLADLGRRADGLGLFGDLCGVLVDPARHPGELPARRHRALAAAGCSAPWPTARSRRWAWRRPAPAPASSSASSPRPGWR